MSSSANNILTIGARASRLSRAQVAEILEALQKLHPKIDFSPMWVNTTGDLDQFTSLRSLDKTDFFTREIDQLLLSGACRVAVHSAKDLPDPLPKGLSQVALTEGVDPSDSLVMLPGISLSTLPSYARIGTSSARREATVASLRPDLALRRYPGGD